MAANGISTLSTKEERQLAKLQLAQAKRKGQIITEGGGTWSADGIDNPDAPWYEELNTLDLSLLPDLYNDDSTGPDDNPNAGGLQPGRPWT